MLFWIYSFSLALITPLLAPYLYFKALFKKKRALSTYFILPSFPHDASRVIWIHAVSLGEVMTAKPLIEALKKRYKDARIYLSTMTETGFQEGSRLEGVRVFYLTLDLYFLQKSLVKKLAPSCFILIEGDVWPALSKALYENKVPQIIVSSKISERSFAKFKKWPFLVSFFYRYFNKLMTQDEVMKKRFLELGVNPDVLFIGGNLKLAASYAPQEPCEVSQLAFLHLDPSKKTVVIACTHQGEEKLILEALSSQLSSINLIIAPRHPQRFTHVEKLLRSMEIDFSKYSKPKKTEVSCYLLDAIGHLKEVYVKADIVILGGSFIPGVGGHNLMEPIFAGCPVITGPYMEGQRGPLEVMLEHQLGQQCDVTALLETLNASLQQTGFKARFKAFKDASMDVTHTLQEAIESLLE